MKPTVFAKPAVSKMLERVPSDRFNTKYFLMKLFKVIFLFSLFLSSTMAFAQHHRFSTQENEYVTELVKLLDETRVNDLIILSKEFESAWSAGKFTEDQKQTIIRLSQQIIDNKYKVSPHLSNFVSLLLHASDNEQVLSNSMDDLLLVTEKVLDKYQLKDFAEYLVAMRNFVKSNALYYSSYNRLYMIGGSYKFDFIEEEETVEVIPSETTWNKDPEPVDDWGKKDDGGWFTDWDNNTDDWAFEENDPWNTQVQTQVDEEESYKAKFLQGAVVQPVVKGAVIKVENTDLSMVSTYDSVFIKNTSGTLLIRDFMFVGEGGTFDWSVAGLNSDSVFVTFKEYHFKVTKPEISAENVTLTYIGKLSEPVDGVFEFLSRKREKNKEYPYPRFKSYSAKIKAKIVDEGNIEYKGGFSLSGRTINSTSVIPGLAVLDVKLDGNRKFMAKSKRFVFKDSLFYADRASVVIYQNRDSIFHPGLTLKYNTSKKQLILLKEKGWYKNLPFIASYFNIEFDADMVKWSLEADSLDISILGARHHIPAVFESTEYYNPEKFDNLAGMYKFHPLLVVHNYTKKLNVQEFYYTDLAQSLKINKNTVQGAMRSLMQQGFVDYDEYTGLVKLKRKTNHYILSNSNKKDYDNMMIPFISPNKPNATLNFARQEMKVRGIEKFYLSKVLDVYIKPTNHEITLVKDRNFRFEGQVNAGSFEYIGKEFEFKYDSFLLSLNTIDSIKFYVERKGRRQSTNITMKLENKVVETSGTLFINKPDNKSSRKTYPQYPIFTASKGAVVYFDGKEILGGAYDKSIYFSIPPFEIDSLSSSNPDAIVFPGTFHSGGIMPPFDEKLKIMPDNSFGFVHEIKESYELFDGAGTTAGTLTLNNKGLRANGNIEFLSATLQSKDFIFYMDSVTTEGTVAEIREGELNSVAYPQVNVENYKMKWYPYEDRMLLYNLKDPFSLYSRTASLQGVTVLTSKGLFGRGKVSTRGSEAISRQFTFTQSDFSARNARFMIESSNPKKPALFGTDVKLYFDLVRNIAEISPEVEGVAAIDFPFAQVKTSISKATWNLENKKVSMQKPANVDISKSYFYTTRKEQDSIAFNATAAVYDIEKLKLNVSGIPYIKIADAKITPDDNAVTILEKANILPFEKAKVVIDTLNEYHHLFDGNIKIISRTKFEGDATYQFVSANADTFNIKFGSFRLEEDLSKRKGPKQFTVASGPVKESDNMEISPGMIFKGVVTMYANKKALDVDGFVKLDFKTIPNYDTWIKYSSNAEKQDVIIKFEESVDADGEKLNAGLHYESGKNSLYGTFIMPRRTIADEDLFTAGGTLIFDPVKKEYRIYNEEKARGNSFKGKFLSFNENTGDMFFEGPVNFIRNRKDFNITAAAKGKANLKENKIAMNTFMAINYKIPFQISELMAENLMDAVGRMGFGEANRDKTAMLYKLAEIIGERATKEYERKSLQEYVPLVESSMQLIQSLIISDVDLTWSEEHKAWYSSGKLGISNILKKDINARLDGFLEIKKTIDGDDKVRIFFQASPSAAYYINFEDNRLFLYSTDEDFNTMVVNRSKVDKAKFGDFAFVSVDRSEALEFVNRFRKDYYNITEPYQIGTPAAREEPKPSPFLEESPATKEDDDGFGGDDGF